MASVQAGSRAVDRQIRALFAFGAAGDLTDQELLRRFATKGDESAFEALVSRHGPMVFRVCREILADSHDAQDAFQATFLVLLRHSASIRKRGSVGPWLHGVARRISSKALARVVRRRDCERHARASGPPEAYESDPTRGADLAVLHAEIGRLPESYRAAVVLCYLEGLTHDQAAARLGWPVGTVRGRLARARDLLRDRLARRGLAPFVGPWLRLPEIPESLLRSTTRVLTAAREAPGVVPAAVASLAEGVRRTMFWHKSRTVGMAVAALGLIAAGATIMARPVPGGTPSPAPAPAAPRLVPIALHDRMVTRVYYVGDLVFPDRVSDNAKGGFPKLDFAPLIDLIQSTVAPTTWDDRRSPLGGDAEQRGGESKTQDANRRGSITPYFVNVSLIIRQTPEVHELLLLRLHQIRRIRGLPDPMPPRRGDSRPVVNADYETVQPSEDTALAPPVAGSRGLGEANPTARLNATPEIGQSGELSTTDQPAPPTSSDANTRDGLYVIEPGDLLDIEIRLAAPPGLLDVETRADRGRRMSTPEHQVRPDGMVTLGCYGDVQARGLTIQELKAKILAHLGKWYTEEELGLIRVDSDGEPMKIPSEESDRVSVAVTTSSSKSYYVQGHVASPGRYPIRGNVTVVDAIQHAGGLTSDAPLPSVVLVRSPTAGTSKPLVLQIKLSDMLRGDKPETNYQLNPGDRLFVSGDNPSRPGISSLPESGPGGDTKTLQRLSKRLQDQDQRLRQMEQKLDRLIEALEGSKRSAGKE